MTQQTRLYSIWLNMKQRCYNPNSASYKSYGFRGIKMHKDWINDFKAFERWAICNGYRDGLTIDRIDSDIGYYPFNCQWITLKENCSKPKARRVYSVCVSHKRFPSDKKKVLSELTREEAEFEAEKLQNAEGNDISSLVYEAIRTSSLYKCCDDRMIINEYINNLDNDSLRTIRILCQQIQNFNKLEKDILTKIGNALPNMDDFNKGVIVGMAEAFKDKSGESDSETKGEN